MGLKNKLVGFIGESKAALLLKNDGYEILEENYKAAGCEIDIIAEKDNFLIFVEVKTRTNTAAGLPEEAINATKATNISKAALNYIKIKNIQQLNIRCDIVSILLNKKGKVESFKIYENALDLEGASRKKRWLN